MTKMIWIEVEHADDASRLAEKLQSNGVEADISRTIRGKFEVRLQKPRFRRMSRFVFDVVSVVRRWLAEQAPEVGGVTAQTADEQFEIRSPTANGARPRSRDAAPA
jgi:hypothetical protein